MSLFAKAPALRSITLTKNGYKLLVKWACEEINHCHITVHHLYTAIHDKEDKFEETLDQLHPGDPLIYGVVLDFVACRQKVNNLLLTKLDLLMGSTEYLGKCSHGVRVGSGASGGMGMGKSVWLAEAEGIDHNDNNEIDMDKADMIIGQLVDYVSKLALL